MITYDVFDIYDVVIWLRDMDSPSPLLVLKPFNLYRSL